MFGLSAGAVTAIGMGAGALLGGGGSQSSQSSERTMPDWLKNRVAGADGKGGLLGDVDALYRQQSQNGGLNPYQLAGMEAQRQFLTSPQYTAGFDQMRQQGMDLMGRGAAGNPFTTGGAQLGPHLNNLGGMPGPMNHPSPNTQPFQYGMNPALSGALQPFNVNPVNQVPQPGATTPTLEELIAELQRQQNPTYSDPMNDPGGRG